MAIGHQEGMDVQIEGAFGEDREGLRKLAARGEPSGNRENPGSPKSLFTIFGPDLPRSSR